MILVTGGAGYIGSHFIKLYLEQNPNESVVIFDNLSTGSPVAIETLKSLFGERLYFEQGDILDESKLKDVFFKYKPIAVAHFAAIIRVDESMEIPGAYFKNNVSGSLALMNAMEEAGVRKMLFSSTCVTYGNPQYTPLDEKHPTNPISVYGLNKLMIEEAMRGYALSKGWSTVALRYFNVAGCDPTGEIGKSHGFTPHLIMQCLKVANNDPEVPQLRLFGNDYNTPDGTCIRDYIHIQDLVNGHIKALNYINNTLCSQSGGFEVFNLGTGTGSSVYEILEASKRVTQKEIPYTLQPRRAGDSEILICNTSKSKSILDWQAEYSLEEAISSAWNWMQAPKY